MNARLAPHGSALFVVVYLIVGVFVGCSVEHIDTGEPAPAWLFVVTVLAWPVVVLATWGN